jgi:hypothetical protein
MGQDMKKRLTCIAALMVLVMILPGCGNDGAEGNNESYLDSLVGTSVLSEYVRYDYESLKSEAMIIAKVQVRDNLTTYNSEITYEPQAAEPTILDFMGIRKVKILEIYKGDAVKAGDIMEIIEPAAVTEDEFLYASDYKPMNKGSVYIVFLSNNTASGKYSIISANNGIVDLTNPDNNTYPGIADKAIAEFGGE